jgi:hypothetical protein
LIVPGGLVHVDILALGAHAKVEKLEKKLKENGILQEGWDRDHK